VKLQGGKSIMKAAKKPYAAPEMEVIEFAMADLLSGDNSPQDPQSDEWPFDGEETTIRQDW
jgi:hypothetical protein